MIDLELAEAILMEHYRVPRHQVLLSNLEDLVASKKLKMTEVVNSLCGDVIKLGIDFNSSNSLDSWIQFHGSGCALSIAGASIVCSEIFEKPQSEALVWAQNFITNIETGVPDASSTEEVQALFFASKENPARMKCATLGAKALVTLLEN